MLSVEFSSSAMNSAACMLLVELKCLGPMVFARIELNHVKRVSLIWLTMVSNTSLSVRSPEFGECAFVTLIGSATPEAIVLTKKADRKRTWMNEVFVPHLGRLTKANPPQRHERKHEECLGDSIQIYLVPFFWRFTGFCAIMN